jgi:alanine dehydrogenase
MKTARRKKAFRVPLTPDTVAIAALGCEITMVLQEKFGDGPWSDEQYEQAAAIVYRRDLIDAIVRRAGEPLHFVGHTA